MNLLQEYLASVFPEAKKGKSDGQKCINWPCPSDAREKVSKEPPKAIMKDRGVKTLPAPGNTGEALTELSECSSSPWALSPSPAQIAGLMP